MSDFIWTVNYAHRLFTQIRPQIIYSTISKMFLNDILSLRKKSYQIIATNTNYPYWLLKLNIPFQEVEIVSIIIIMTRKYMSTFIFRDKDLLSLRVISPRFKIFSFWRACVLLCGPRVFQWGLFTRCNSATPNCPPPSFHFVWPRSGWNRRSYWIWTSSSTSGSGRQWSAPLA